MDTGILILRLLVGLLVAGGVSVNRLTTWPFLADVEGAGTPVRGRAEELAFVEARLDALARGAGGIVLVEGPAGIGRSRMLAEASASAKRRGMRTFQGGADPDEQFVPLGPLLDGLFAGTSRSRVPTGYGTSPRRPASGSGCSRNWGTACGRPLGAGRCSSSSTTSNGATN